jgi:hypothetical protein
MSAFEPKLLSQKDFDTFCQEAVVSVRVCMCV